jgi:phage shock protein PspC (stress-responsive transcriptional regulator)
MRPVTEDQATAPAQPPPAVPAGARRLRRTRRRLLAGVCGGIAAYLDRGPVLVRVAFLVLTPLWGLGIALYVLAWLTVPVEGNDESAAERVLRRLARAPSWLQVVVLALAAVLLIQGFAGEGFGVLSGVVLIAAGIALFRQDGRDGTPAPARTVGGGGATALWDPPAPVATQAPVGPAPSSWPPPAPRPRREPSILGRATLGLTLLLLGIVAGLDLAGIGEATAERLLALSLVMIGGGLVVGARVGRARGLILLGIPLLAALVGVNALRLPSGGGLGELAARPGSLADVRDEYRLFLGTSTVDLSGVAFRDGPTRVAASVGIGDLVVIVPEDADVEVEASVRAGLLDLFDRVDEGTELQRRVVDRGDGEGGRLVLDVRAGLGAVDVRRAEEGVRGAAS